MTTEPEIEDQTRRHNEGMAVTAHGRWFTPKPVMDALAAAGVVMPPEPSREDRLTAARIEARAAFERGDVGEAYRILSEAVKLQ